MHGRTAIRQPGLELPQQQKVTLQDGRVTIVTVQYIGEECVIFDGNDQLVE